MRSAAAADFRVPMKAGYVMHGVNVAVESDQTELLDRLHRRLAPFASQGGEIAAPELRFELRTTARGADADGRLARQRTIYEVAGTQFRYDDVCDIVFAVHGDRVIGVCNARLGSVRFEVAADVVADPDLYAEILFTVLLVELLKRHGRFSIHAAGVSVGDRAILLAGPSGAGKSTLAVALLQSLGSRAGFLGDDMLFLRSDPPGIRVLGWPEAIDVGEWTQRSVPGLALRMEVIANARRKGRIAYSRVGDGSLSLDAVPEVIVFPRITGRSRSTLIPMSEDEALVELAPNVLLTEVTSSQAHLAALGSLARRCRCYRLESGEDVDRQPELLMALW